VAHYLLSFECNTFLDESELPVAFIAKAEAT